MKLSLRDMLPAGMPLTLARVLPALILGPPTLKLVDVIANGPLPVNWGVGIPRAEALP